MFANLAPILLPLLTASILINEVLYDPAGPDSGGEFVELLCASPDGCALGGLRLEFVNGDDPEPSRVVWDAPAEGRIDPGARWLIGGAGVANVDEVVALGLQNGPDALRLFRESELLDAVAWGELTGQGEGQPAPDVSGEALARVPDGADSDDNATDFASRAPTPGAPNSYAMQLSLRRVWTEPPWLPRPGEILLQVEAEFVGDDPDQRGSLSVLQGDVQHATREFEGARIQLIQWSTRLAFGYGATDLLVLARSEATSDTVALPLWVGRGRLWLNEVLPAPAQGEPEWIELRSLASSGEWRIRDAVSEPRSFRLDAAAPLQLLSEDCARLRLLRASARDVPCVELDGGWISLNNSIRAGEEYADRIALLDEGGRVMDEFHYGPELRTGRSYERAVVGARDGGQWFVSPAEPTPGRENLVGEGSVPTHGLELSPEPFTPDGDGVGDLLHIVLAAAGSTRSAAAAVHELAGARVRDLGTTVNAGGVLRWVWDGRDDRGEELPWGAYVVVVRDEGGAGRWRSLCTLGRR